MASSKIFVLWAQVLKFLIAGHTCPSFMKHIYFNGLFFWVIPLGFHGGSDGGKQNKTKTDPLANARNSGSITGLGRYPGEGNGYPLQYSCLENSMDNRDWRATVHRVTKSDMTE